MYKYKFMMSFDRSLKNDSKNICYDKHEVGEFKIRKQWMEEQYTSVCEEFWTLCNENSNNYKCDVNLMVMIKREVGVLQNNV